MYGALKRRDRSRLARSFDDAEKFFRILAGWFLARQGSEESGKVRGEFFVFEDMVGDTAGIHGGIFEELEPVIGVRLEAKLSRPGTKGLFVSRWLQDFALDFAPVAWVMAVLQAEFAQAETFSRS